MIEPSAPAARCAEIPPSPRKVFAIALASVLLMVFLYWVKPPVSFAFDPNDEKCLPDMRLSLMLHQRPTTVHDGDLVFWKPFGPLAYVKQRYVMKQVAGVAGDHLQIRGETVLINGKPVVQGLALARLYHATPQELQRDEVIPAGKLFVIGTHPHSDDSRYWGYLDVASVDGRALKIF